MKVIQSASPAAIAMAHLRWHRTLHVVMGLWVLVIPAQAMAFTLQLDSQDTIQTPIVGDVQSFRFTIDIDAPLAAGVYENPPLVQIDYEVSGVPVVGSPSEFEAFALSRSIDGAEFYQTGNELVFEIADTVVLSDGVQAAELVGISILSLDAREEGTGRFHPAKLVLRADGTGQLQNSDNVPDLAEPEGIPAGSEYITDIAFDSGNLTLIAEDDSIVEDENTVYDPDQVGTPDTDGTQSDGTEPDDEVAASGNSSDSSSGFAGIAFLLLLGGCLLMRRKEPQRQI